MRKIIGGKMYDTDTATQIGSYEYGYGGNLDYICETLYRKKTGELFLHGEGGPRSKYACRVDSNSWCGGQSIIPESDFDAKEWVAEHCDTDIYVKLFGSVPE